MNSRGKKIKDGNKKHKNDVSFEVEVAEQVTKRHPIARTQLKNDLLKAHDGERGYSEKTIDKKLLQMVKDGKLESVGFDDFSKHGITDTDGRVIYYVPKRDPKIKEYLDKIFEYIKLDDPVAQKLAFEEIIMHEDEYFFDPDQLDILASRLDSKDNKFISDILNTLCEYILGRGIEPSNKDELLKTLRELLGRCKIGSLDYPNAKGHILWLLGHYKDSAVIEQLKEDAEELEDFTSTSGKYCNEYVAPLIKENLSELFDLHIKLRQEGKEKASEFITQIKNYAYDPQKLKTLNRDEELPKKIQKFRRERTK